MLAAALLLIASLLALPAAASPGRLVAVKGFVLSREGEVLVVQRGAGAPVRVVLGPETVVTGGRGSAAEIAVHDLVSAEGSAGADEAIRAARVDVVLTADGLTVGRPASAGGAGAFWRWLANSALAAPGR